jgi:hypothetical protein
MTRKESEKDSERPHYYSQFWLDVAAGRRIIGAPRPNEETDIDVEPEAELEPVMLHRSARTGGSSALSDGFGDTLSHPEVEPDEEIEDLIETELEEPDVDGEIEEEVEPPLTEVEEAEIPDVDLAAPEIENAEEQEEDIFTEEEEEEEEDVDWPGRGRKKPRPGRQLKTPKKPVKREPRRGF